LGCTLQTHAHVGSWDKLTLNEKKFVSNMFYVQNFPTNENQGLYINYEAWQIIKVPIFNLQSSAHLSTFLLIKNHFVKERNLEFKNIFLTIPNLANE
jgi:hypothetical protein